MPGAGAPAETTPWTTIAARALPRRRGSARWPGSTRFGALRRKAGLRGRSRGLIEELAEQEPGETSLPMQQGRTVDLVLRTWDKGARHAPSRRRQKKGGTARHR